MFSNDEIQMVEKIVLKKFKNLISEINANKTALSFHHMPSRMAKIKKMMTNAGTDVGKEKVVHS